MNGVKSLKTNFTKEQQSKIIGDLKKYFSKENFSNQKVLNKLIENLEKEKVPEIFKTPEKNEAKLQQYKCKLKLIKT